MAMLYFLALSSLPADKRVLMDKPRNPDSHIINRKMLVRIVGIGIVFFLFLSGLWQLMWHNDISSVSDLLTMDSVKLFFSGFADLSHSKTHLGAKELGIFFSIFVMLQFWNLFNAKYYRTGRSLLLDIADLFRDPAKVKSSFSAGFIWISLVIVFGQVIIVNFAGRMFSVDALSVQDWLLILLLTSPVLIVSDILRTIKVFTK